MELTAFGAFWSITREYRSHCLAEANPGRTNTIPFSLSLSLFIPSSPFSSPWRIQGARRSPGLFFLRPHSMLAQGKGLVQSPRVEEPFVDVCILHGGAFWKSLLLVSASFSSFSFMLSSRPRLSFPCDAHTWLGPQGTAGNLCLAPTVGFAVVRTDDRIW